MILTRRQMLAAAATISVGLAGCSRRSGSSLEFWAMGAEAENMADLLATLPRSGLPPVRVQPLPWSAAHEKLLTAYAGGSLPDLGQVGNSWIAELSAIDAIQPVPAELEHLVDGQFPGVVETNRIDGRLMALPWSTLR